MNKISQRSARAYKRRVEELEKILIQEKGRWGAELGPGWINIETLILSSESYAKVDTARRLNHEVILRCEIDNQLRLYAERQEKA